MKFLVLTDLHGKKSAMEWINPLIHEQKIDSVIFLGDAVSEPTTAEESIRIIKMIDCLNILAIPGNIDNPGVIDILDQAAVNMHGAGKQVGDAYIVGFGGSNPTIFNTPTEFTEKEIFEGLDKVSKDGMILMVHAPAYGINDKIPSGLSVGSKGVLDIVKKYRPKVVLSGHIHEDFGRKEEAGTIFVNPGPAMNGRYAIMETDGNDVSVKVFGPLD